MCVLPAYMSCIRWSLMPPPKNLGSFPRASQHMSCVAVSVHVFLPFSRLAAIFSNRPQQTAGVSGSRARRFVSFRFGSLAPDGALACARMCW